MSIFTYNRKYYNNKYLTMNCPKKKIGWHGYGVFLTGKGFAAY